MEPLFTPVQAVAALVVVAGKAPDNVTEAFKVSVQTPDASLMLMVYAP